MPDCPALIAKGTPESLPNNLTSALHRLSPSMDIVVLAILFVFMSSFIFSFFFIRILIAAVVGIMATSIKC